MFSSCLLNMQIKKQFTHGFEIVSKRVWFSFDKSPVGVNTLNQILPDMCKAAGLKRKTSHSLRVTCASTLFNAGVDSKLIRDRTGHKSDALLKYEKPEEKVIS